MPGSYRLINYSGALSGSMAIGSIPSGFASSQIQTAIAGQVNLIAVQIGLAVQFWDGTHIIGNGVIDGGTSTWNNSTTNWANLTGSINQSWISGMGIFTATAGTVTLGEPVTAMALQFSTSGYNVVGNGTNTLTLIRLPSGAPPLIRVDPGVTAEIDATIAGSNGLEKGDTGTLILGGNNTYTGGTTITAGTLQIGNGGTTGSIVGDVTNNGVLDFSRFDALTYSGVVSGTGALVKDGAGVLTLTGKYLSGRNDD
jgi:fibronectin-binding autotransporter adhesin